MTSSKLYLEDLVPGQLFESGSHTLTATEIKDFAGRYDPQFFHLDDEAAKASLFGGLAASGWNVASVTMRLMVESSPIAGGLIGAGAEIAWPRPTRPGDTLRVVTEVVEVTPSRSRPERGMVLVRCKTLNQLDEIVQTMASRMVVPRRAVPETDK
ncbi:MAG TPA: MaoC family dehydratase [Magnetospirillaceae bacterium]|nr:MaoC family dehydratase [Magnetospirillaceae bacterium]